MKPTARVLLAAAASLLLLLAGLWIAPVEADSQLFQQPTVAIATVTSTPSGPSVIVNPDQEQINVRAGPGTDYPVLGVLVAGQEVIARGRSPQGLWIQILYFGVPGDAAWVYAPLVSAPTGDLPILEPPPTPTPRVTPTIDPTLAAQFIVESPPTRLPTFTAPPPLVIPTFEAQPESTPANPVPMGLVIISLTVFGFFGAFVSLLRGRL